MPHGKGEGEAQGQLLMLHLMLIQEVRNALRDVVKELEDNTKVAISCRRQALCQGASQPLLNHRPLESMASGPALSPLLLITTACPDSSKPCARPPCQSSTDSSPQDRQCQDNGVGPQRSCALPVWPSQLDPAASSLRLWTEVYPWL